MRVCMVPDCGGKYVANNFCRKHYNETYHIYHPKDKRVELAQEIAALTSISRTKAESVINLILKVIAHRLQQKEKVHIHDFGTFRIKNNKVEFIPTPKILEALNSKDTPKCT